jgi:hypothetical protein
MVLNFPSSFAPVTHVSAVRRSVLFLTAPYSLQAWWSESDLNDILDVLIQSAADGHAELIIRVHPLDTVGVYRRRIDAWQSRAGQKLAVTYSQRDDLSDLLARSAVAVTFASTVFLECLRWQVPIVSFDWHHFPFKDQISRLGVFNFARSKKELNKLIGRALSGQLPTYGGSTAPFVAPTPEVVLRAGLEIAVRPNGGGVTSEVADTVGARAIS